MDWKEYFESHHISAEQAAELVKPGMRVSFPFATGQKVQRALAARADRIGGQVGVRLSAPLIDPGWLSQEMGGAFQIEFELFIGNLGRPAHDRLSATYVPNLFSMQFPMQDGRPDEVAAVDLVICNVSPPNAQGFVCFGPNQWNKRGYLRHSKCAVAEVDPSIVRTHGDVWAHVTEFQYFVDAVPAPTDPAQLERELEAMAPEKAAGIREIIKEVGPERLIPLAAFIQRATLYELRALLGVAELPQSYHAIAGHLSELIDDGVTVQIGVGEPSARMPKLGVFDKKHDLGLHTEMVAPGIAKLVDAGIINGRRKTLHRGKAVAIAWSGSDAEDLKIINDNPAFELYDPDYVLNIPRIAQNHRQTSINNALAVDLTGQITAETVAGARMYNGTGGAPETHLGAFLSPGGRAITLLQATALNGAVSRIVPQHPEGTLVTVPRFFADTVVTEFGIARMVGKNHRERAAELIAVAHPDFRPQLREAAKRLLG